MIQGGKEMMEEQWWGMLGRLNVYFTVTKEYNTFICLK
jgi:hypothetical protein